jgi:hypothetical protein
MEAQHYFYAVLTALFPFVLTLGICLIPIVPNYANHDLAEAAVAKSKRWFWGHLISAIGFGLGIGTTFILHFNLVGTPLDVWQILDLILLIVGGAAQMFGLGADGIGPLAVRRAGGSARQFFDGSTLWVAGTFIAGSILFSLGQIALIVLIGNLEIFSNAMNVVLLVAAIFFSVSAAIPSGYGLYVTAVTALIIYLPLAGYFWQIATLGN